jgi:protein SCO1/2
MSALGDWNIGRLRVTPSRIVVALIVLAAACSHREPPKQYPLRGQVLGVKPEKLELTVKHDDIPGYMPAMTMTYNVSTKALLEGRTPGELITGTLEAGDAGPRITAVTHVGSAPLPEANEVGLATELLDVGDAVPDAALIDQQDRRRSLAEWRGSLTLVTFIYTRCPLPDFCPLMDQNFQALQRLIARDPALAGRVKLLSLSFDPEYDTPAILAAHAAHLKADPTVWTFATSDRVTIDRLAARFGVGLVRPTGETQITHNLRTTLIGPDGKVRRVYSGNDWTPGAVLSDLRAAK